MRVERIVVRRKLERFGFFLLYGQGEKDDLMFPFVV